MKKIFFSITIIYTVFAMGCAENVKTEKISMKELELKEKELELKEKELELQKREMEMEQNKNKKSENKKPQKKLMHLFVANGGMIGYYDDGSVVGCPRCDYLQENLDMMYQKQSSETWDVNNPKSILENTNEEDWALFNYEWKKDKPD